MQTRTAVAVIALCSLPISCAYGQASMAAASQPATQQTRSRQAFAAAMAKVKRDMPVEEARSILGPPDDILTGSDDHFLGRHTIASGRGSTEVYVKEMWAYGTDGHLTLPTLGYVYVTEDGKVYSSDGGRGTPPDLSLFSEQELRSLLRLLHRVTDCYGGCEYNPLPTIQAVNTLIPLGKKRALAAIEECMRVGVATNETSMFAVLHTLFEVPELPGYFEPPAIAIVDPESSEKRRRVPRLPIAIQDDIPFVIGQWIDMGGQPESPSMRLIPFLRAHGVMRSKPLVPTTRPFDAAKNLYESVRWLYEGDIVPENGRTILMAQALRMLDTIYQPPVPKAQMERYLYAMDEDLPRTLAAFKNVEIQWDARRMIYTFADGTTLPEGKPDEQSK